MQVIVTSLSSQIQSEYNFASEYLQNSVILLEYPP